MGTSVYQCDCRTYRQWTIDVCPTVRSQYQTHDDSFPLWMLVYLLVRLSACAQSLVWLVVPVAIAALVTGVLACLLRSSTGTLVCPVFPLDTSVLLISGVPVWLPAPSDRGEMMVTLAGTGSSDSSE